MLRKSFIFLFIAFVFFDCASNKPVRPAFHNSVSITFYPDNKALVSVSYCGNNWAFIKAVELKAPQGDKIRISLDNINRKVYKDASVFECGSFWLNQKLADAIKSGAQYEARIISRDKIFNYQNIDISYLEK